MRFFVRWFEEFMNVLAALSGLCGSVFALSELLATFLRVRTQFKGAKSFS